MVEFRILTDEGVDMFRTFLDESARSGESAPTHLLTDRNYSTEFSPMVHLQSTMTFKNKHIF